MFGEKIQRNVLDFFIMKKIEFAWVHSGSKLGFLKVIVLLEVYGGSELHSIHK